KKLVWGSSYVYPLLARGVAVICFGLAIGAEILGSAMLLLGLEKITLLFAMAKSGVQVNAKTTQSKM
ncbi:MAG: hypothetical protein RSD17_02455, partial [Oscillospiraceae bacterium]